MNKQQPSRQTTADCDDWMSLFETTRIHRMKMFCRANNNPKHRFIYHLSGGKCRSVFPKAEEEKVVFCPVMCTRGGNC